MSVSDLNYDLELISERGNQWKMCFNPDPTKPSEWGSVCFEFKEWQLSPLYFNANQVKHVCELNYLDVN